MYDLSRICNLCLKDLNLLDGDSKHNLDEAIHFILPELIILQPESFVRVCHTCRSIINNFYNFKIMCLKNNATLWSNVNTVQKLTNDQKPQYISINEEQTESNKVFEQSTEDVTNTENYDHSLFTSEQRPKISDDHQKLHFVANEEEKKQIETKKIFEVTTCSEAVNNSENPDPLNFEHVQIKSEVIELGKTFYSSRDSVGETSNFAECESSISNDEDSQNIESNSDVISSAIDNKIEVNNVKKDTDTRDFECLICNWKFKQKSHLNVHMKMHKNIRDFECSICGKKFVRSEELKDHTYVHSETKNFECTVCHKKYIHRVSLARHMKKHTGYDKEYECSVCNKKFTVKASFVLHMKIHEGVKNFECEICKWKFLQKTHLNKHMRIHSGTKDFECSFCHKKFVQNSYLKSHLKVHTGTKDFVCSVCNKAFLHKVNLISHLRIKHGVHNPTK